MKRIASAKFIVLLLASLLLTQLDPGGLVICLAENGNLSYSFNCACDNPTTHGSDCGACHQPVADVQADSCFAPEVLPPCCGNDQEKAPSGDDEACCHNFSINLIASTPVQFDGPGFVNLELNSSAPLAAVIHDEDFQPDALLRCGLPPPPSERVALSILITDCTRLLL